MRDSNLLLDSIDIMNHKLQLITYEKNSTDELCDTFVLMGEYFETLNTYYNDFNERIKLVLQKMESLNKFVSEDVLEEYYSIYRSVGDRVGDTFHKLSSVSDEFKK